MKGSIFIFIALVGAFLGIQGTTPIEITGKVTDAYGNPVVGASVVEKGTFNGTTTDFKGLYAIKVRGPKSKLVVSYVGYERSEVAVGDSSVVDIVLKSGVALEEVIVTGSNTPGLERNISNVVNSRANVPTKDISGLIGYVQDREVNWNTEDYGLIEDNRFFDPRSNPLSTFSADVDRASYANLRRFLNNGQMPPVDAVRIEEMINYFDYNYATPVDGETPFSVNAEVGPCPWNEQHKLVHIGIQGREIPTDDLPPSNLVFLLDVSGSMQDYNKLPLVKSSFKMLLGQLREKDRVAIVVYAGAAGLVLPSTPGSEKNKILEAIDALEAGGSTAGGAGIRLAYKTARESFIEGGNNRVILATDGDFNIGQSSDAELVRIIEKERESGVFLTVLGYGTGNYKDNKMQELADHGNGNHAYIDNITEAKKVFVNEFGGTLFTIAKDVKFQVEFNPNAVAAYRLIGYENRLLNDEDFNDDTKDAGEIGSGHTVTVLYEIIPKGVESTFIPKTDPLKYQSNQQVIPGISNSSELLHVKIRYKQPDGDKSNLIEQPVPDATVDLDSTSENFRWSAAVASFGMLLRDSKYKGNSSYSGVHSLAQTAQGKDEHGYRREFISLVSGLMPLVEVEGR